MSLLALALKDETVRLWDAGTGEEVQTLENVPRISTISLLFDGGASIEELYLLLRGIVLVEHNQLDEV